MKNGTLWLDTDGRGIQAHGGSILQHNGIFYWYGENKDTDTHNRSVDFVGFSCYKSRDLLHWENCGLVLSLSMSRDTTCTRTASASAPAYYITQKRKNLCCGFIWITAATPAPRSGLP